MVKQVISLHVLRAHVNSSVKTEHGEDYLNDKPTDIMDSKTVDIIDPKFISSFKCMDRNHMLLNIKK